MEKHPLILVPGLMCDVVAWQPVLEPLSQVATCHVVDHGHAGSLVTMAQQLLAHAPPRFALAGHSMGGRVAMEVMRLAPERVTHLGIFDTGFQPRMANTAGEEETRKRMALLAIARQQGVRAMAEQWVQGMVAPHRLSDRALIDAVIEMFARKTADIFEQQVQALLNRPDGTDVLARVNVPALVLCGQEDSWSNVAQHEAIARLIPAHPEVVAIPQAGHMVMMEAPEPVARAMQDWLVQ